MSKPISVLKNEWRKKFNEINTLEEKLLKENNPLAKLHHELAAARRELSEIESDLFGNWAPAARKKGDGK